MPLLFITSPIAQQQQDPTRQGGPSSTPLIMRSITTHQRKLLLPRTEAASWRPQRPTTTQANTSPSSPKSPFPHRSDAHTWTPLRPYQEQNIQQCNQALGPWRACLRAAVCSLGETGTVNFRFEGATTSGV
jgi:hypothetical protein